MAWAWAGRVATAAFRSLAWIGWPLTLATIGSGSVCARAGPADMTPPTDTMPKTATAARRRAGGPNEQSGKSGMETPDDEKAVLMTEAGMPHKPGAPIESARPRCPLQSVSDYRRFRTRPG